jgi:TRAP-type C4-dicarboxylate transport system permease small subunit
MQKANLINKVIVFLENLCTLLAGVSFTLLLVLIVPGTISRYLFNYPFHFVEEYSGYLFIALGFLGLSYALRKGSHISVSAGVKYLKNRTRIGLEIATTIIGIFIAIILFWYSFKFCYSNYLIKTVSSSIMMTPLWVPQLFIWIGWLVFILSLIKYLINKIKAFKDIRASNFKIQNIEL